MGQIRRCASTKYFNMADNLNAMNEELSASFLIIFGHDELRPRAPIVVNKQPNSRGC